jgi:hypothetical protein
MSTLWCYSYDGLPILMCNNSISELDQKSGINYIYMIVICSRNLVLRNLSPHFSRNGLDPPIRYIFVPAPFSTACFGSQLHKTEIGFMCRIQRGKNKYESVIL